MSLKGRTAHVVATEKIEIREREVKHPTENEVLVSIKLSGVCHSDVHMWAGESVMSKAPFPRFPGHEILGDVHSVGPRVSSISPGKRVLVYPWIGCDKCDRCAKGLYNLCSSRSKPLIGGGHTECGLSEFVRVPHPKFLAPADGIDPEVAVPLPCAGLTAYNAVTTSQRSHVAGDGVLVIIGCGGLGLMGIQLAKIVTKQTVVALDVDPAKLKLAKEYGADFAFNSKGNVRNDIQKLSGVKNRTVEAVIDFVGMPVTHNLAVRLAANGGQIVMVGIHGGAIKWNVAHPPLRSLIYSGIFVGSLPDFHALINIARQGKLKSIVSEVRPFEEAQLALERLKDGKVQGRVALQISKL